MVEECVGARELERHRTVVVVEMSTLVELPLIASSLCFVGIRKNGAFGHRHKPGKMENADYVK